MRNIIIWSNNKIQNLVEGFTCFHHLFHIYLTSKICVSVSTSPTQPRPSGDNQHALQLSNGTSRSCFEILGTTAGRNPIDEDSRILSDFHMPTIWFNNPNHTKFFGFQGSSPPKPPSDVSDEATILLHIQKKGWVVYNNVKLNIPPGFPGFFTQISCRIEIHRTLPELTSQRFGSLW